MKISLAALVRLISLAAALFLAAPASLFAQGEDNPVGAYGSFNGNSFTGCSYDPYTGNATRTIVDLSVTGSVGAYPLVWARTMNTRDAGNSYFGGGGGWRHPYAWTGGVGTYNPTLAIPNSYVVNYPDGRVITFSGSGGGVYAGPLGMGDRFQSVAAIGYCYLLLPDGGKVRFLQTGDYDLETEQYSNLHLLAADQITDPHNLVTTLSYDANNRLAQVTEPAGRWLKVHYTTGSIDQVTAGHGTTTAQTVTYTYSAYGTYSVLTKAAYSDSTNGVYTYQNSNVVSNGHPLIKTCNDVRYPGPMNKIAYAFVSGGSYGELWKEEYIDGTPVATLTMSGTTRTETRPDGATRSFQYGATGQPYSVPAAYLLGSFTDFNGVKTYYGYDASYFVNTVKDRNGNVTTFTHSNLGKTTKVTHASDGSYVQYGYDTTGYYLTSRTDELFHQITYLLNPAPTYTVKEVDYPDNGVEKFIYNGYAQILTHTMVSNTSTAGSGGTGTFIYDTGNRGQLVQSYPPATTSDASPQTHPTIYTYDPVNDHVQTIKDPRLHTTTLDFYERGQLKTITNPDADGSQTKYAYNPDGTLQSLAVDYSATAAATVSYTYDDYKRIKSMTTPLRFTGDTTPRTTNFYYGIGDAGLDDYTHTDENITRIVLPSGKVVKHVYDNNKRLSSSTTGYGTAAAATTGYTYYPGGNLKTKTEPNYYPSGVHWTYYIDGRNRLQYVDDPISTDRNADNHTVSFSYDVASNKKTVRSANDQLTTYDTYDAMKRLTQMTVNQGTATPPAITKYTWTKARKLDTMTDPKLHVYSYDYDRQNRLVTTTYPAGGGTETRLYDFDGNVATFTNRAGNVQTFTYDNRNRETFNSWDDGVTPSRTLGYDDASRMTTCNAPGSNIAFTYYNDGLLHTQDTLTGYFQDNTHRVVSYAYDPDGERASLSSPTGDSFGYTYTAREQLDTVKNNVAGTTIINYDYDATGNPKTRTPNNVTSSNYITDALNRLTSITHNLTGSTRVFNYGYNEVSDRTYVQRVKDSVGIGADGYGYDLNHELTSCRLSGALSGGVVSGGSLTSYNYDAGGNWSSTVGSTTTTYNINALNQYNSITGQANPTYDGDGNLKTYNGGVYSYDALNRLTSATVGGTTISIYYDGLNRQVARYVGGLITLSVWDGWSLLAEYQSTAFNPTVDTLVNSYVRGAGSELVKEMVNNRYYYSDASGSTSQLATSGGVLLESYTYNGWGLPVFTLPSSGSGADTPESASAYGVDLLSNGQKWYSQVGLYDLRNRFFSPMLGRFLQPDPIGFAGDSENIYRYCGNNPVNLSDPSGLVTFQVGFSVNVQAGSFAYNGTLGLAFDGHGNIGRYVTNLGGLGVGADASAGLALAVSDADTINGLRGGFAEVSGGGGILGHGSVNGFVGKDGSKTVHGGGITIGLGNGGGANIGASGTTITPLWSPSSPASPAASNYGPPPGTRDIVFYDANGVRDTAPAGELNVTDSPVDDAESGSSGSDSSGSDSSASESDGSGLIFVDGVSDGGGTGASADAVNDALLMTLLGIPGGGGASYEGFHPVPFDKE